MRLKLIVRSFVCAKERKKCVRRLVHFSPFYIVINKVLIIVNFRFFFLILEWNLAAIRAIGGCSTNNDRI